MKLFKSYGFWTTLAGAVVILMNALGELFGFAIESKLIENVIMAVAGVLVALGIVSINGGSKKQEGEEDKQIANENNAEEQEKQNNENQISEGE